MHKPEVEDLQFQLHQIKKENLELRNENQLLKVKIRKLNEEITRKNKQVDILLDPKKTNCISKVFSKHGATLMMKMKDENFALCKKLAEKDMIIKKLQSDLETARLYTNDKAKLTCPQRLYECQEYSEKDDDLSSRYSSKIATARPNTKHRSRSVTTDKKTRSKSPSPMGEESLSGVDLQKDYMALLNSNLQKIKQCGYLIQNEKSTRSNNSVTPSQSDAPHEEIQQLQGYLLNVLSEVDCLKNTICELQKEQTKTSLVLSDKSSDINKLVTEIASFNRQALVLNCPNPNVPERAESVTTEPMSTDISDECDESDYNETTECSIVQSKSVAKEKDTMRMCTTKSVSIQTARSFCSRPFTAASTASDSEKSPATNTAMTGPGADEYDIEVVYL